ncbi:MAG: xanthine dehydrogenase family protein subunit M, partial [Tabrizicola sp.]|nr:xanthine dehydrogenase family protein subunit M [Tabrizicola sp.]
MRPGTLAEAVAHRAGGAWRLLAGATDVYPGQGARLSGPVLDLAGLGELRGISRNGGLRIGAMTTWADIAGADLPPALSALQEAAVQVGGRQIQMVGTLGGNLCNASPAADGVPPLLAVEAEVELVSATGVRQMPLSAFLTGPRQTALQPDEILTAVLVPEAALAGRSRFLKLGARRHLVISIAMVAARVVVTGGRIADLAVAVGACS